MDINHLDVYDLYPALLLTLIVTASFAFGFALGVVLGLLRCIILPVLPTLRRAPSHTIPYRDYLAVKAAFDALPTPDTTIPSTRKKKP